MAMTLQSWVVIAINAAAAIAFLRFGRRHDSKWLLRAGGAFIAATVIMAGASLLKSPSAAALGYAIGFVASVLGFLRLFKVYAARQPPTENGENRKRSTADQPDSEDPPRDEMIR